MVRCPSAAEVWSRDVEIPEKWNLKRETTRLLSAEGDVQKSLMAGEGGRAERGELIRFSLHCWRRRRSCPWRKSPQPGVLREPKRSPLSRI